MADYKLGYTYNKSISYNISFTYYSSSYQPSVSGPSYVKTNEETTFILDSTGMEIESITATNCESNFDSTTNTLTISNPTAAVSVLINAHGESCIIYLGGSKSMASSTVYNWANWINKGTITYTDVYGVSNTIDISTLGLSKENDKYRIYNVLVGSDVICNNIGMNLYNRTGLHTWPQYLYFSNINTSGSEYDSRVSIASSSATASGTFNNVQKCPLKFDADVRIWC